MRKSYSEWQGDVWVQVVDGVLRRREPRDNGVCQSWHPNGVLASEYRLMNGVIEGADREWHDNGVLTKETPMVSGRVHGKVRQWNRDGKLLGEYCMCEGRGVERVWNDDGSLEKEYEQISQNAARGRVWDDLGKAREVFLWDGKPTSKARWVKKLEEAGIPKQSWSTG